MLAGGQRHYLERDPFVQRGSSGRRLGGGARLQSSISRTEGWCGCSAVSNLVAVCWSLFVVMGKGFGHHVRGAFYNSVSVFNNVLR